MVLVWYGGTSASCKETKVTRQQGKTTMMWCGRSAKDVPMEPLGSGLFVLFTAQ